MQFNHIPAFPEKRRIYRDGYATNDFEPHRGMTLRDYFAAAIIQGMNANPELMQVVTSGSILDGTAFEKMARKAYEQADAMLKVRKGI